MTPQDVLVVTVLAIAAVAITLVDLLLCARRKRRSVSPSNTTRSGVPAPSREGAARRESVRRRLAALRTGGNDDE